MDALLKLRDWFLQEFNCHCVLDLVGPLVNEAALMSNQHSVPLCPQPCPDTLAFAQLDFSVLLKRVSQID